MKKKIEMKTVTYWMCTTTIKANITYIDSMLFIWSSHIAKQMCALLYATFSRNLNCLFRWPRVTAGPIQLYNFYFYLITILSIAIQFCAFCVFIYLAKKMCSVFPPLLWQFTSDQIESSTIQSHLHYDDFFRAKQSNAIFVCAYFKAPYHFVDYM